MRLNGKVAVVTGSGDGIGRAVALLMCAEGAKLVINDIGHKSDGTSTADEVVEEIFKAGGTAVANYDSVATMVGGENIINTAISNFGRIDILVNNAGNFLSTPTVEMTEEKWDSIINVHLKGHFACSKPAITEMIKQKFGRIINISSRASFFGRELAYCTAKAGVLGFTTSLSSELQEYGITANAILPSAITNLFPMEVFTIPGQPPQKRLGPEYVAPMIVYLATDEAKDITGRFFFVGSGDIFIYAKPFQIPSGEHIALFKSDPWTIDKLIEVIPPLLRND